MLLRINHIHVALTRGLIILTSHAGWKYTSLKFEISILRLGEGRKRVNQDTIRQKMVQGSCEI